MSESTAKPTIRRLRGHRAYISKAHLVPSDTDVALCGFQPHGGSQNWQIPSPLTPTCSKCAWIVIQAKQSQPPESS